MNEQLFQERFINRDDLYAQQVLRDGKWIFTPRRQHLTPEVVARHLDGKITIAAYPGFQTTKWLVTDIDKPDELETVILRYERLGAPFLLEYSGRKGYHLWTFLKPPAPTRLARQVARTLAGTARRPRPNTAAANCKAVPGIQERSGLHRTRPPHRRA